MAFGDNDKLSALVASKIDAELLVMLTDVDGLYESQPQRDPKAKLIPVVYEIDEKVEKMAGRAGSRLGTGGMVSKIEAIRIASQAGCKVVLANGRTRNVIVKIVEGKEIGTLFLPKRRLSNRKRWILNSSSQGIVEVDLGAETALRNSRSRLDVGVTAVRGSFQAGDVVEIGGFAKGIVSRSSSELQSVLQERKKEKNRHREKRKAVVHVNDIVIC